MQRFYSIVSVSALRKVVVLMFLTASVLSISDVAAVAETKTAVTVFKSPTCGCCSKWVEYMRRHGFTVSIRDMENLEPIKKMAGVPGGLQACHTATMSGYVVEGHVPVEAIRRLLRERPKTHGIAVPGMPAGSPGMESPEPERYSVYSFDKIGKTDEFMVVPAQ